MFHILRKSCCILLSYVMLAVGFCGIAVGESPSVSSSPATAAVHTTDTSDTHYDGKLANFPSRNVTIVVPTALNDKNTAAFGRYMTNRIANVLKYPYYDTTIVNTNTPTDRIEALNLAQIASAQNAEIVILAIPIQDVYVQLQNGYILRSEENYSDDIYIRANVSAVLYYYDRNDRTVYTIRSGYNQTDDSLTMPTHKAVWNRVVNVLLEKLPYKRVPTDVSRYKAPGNNAEMPVIPDPDFQVEQPKNTAYSLKGVSVL